MIPLFAFLYNRGQTNDKNYSIIGIFPYFVLGFVGMILLRNIEMKYIPLIITGLKVLTISKHLPKSS